jgi:hypothetical protein
VHAPGFVRVTLFWQADQDAPQPGQVNVTLVNASGQAVTGIESEPTGGIYPPAQWTRGQIVRDIYSVWLDDQIEPGPFTVRVTVNDNTPIDLGQVQIDLPESS